MFFEAVDTIIQTGVHRRGQVGKRAAPGRCPRRRRPEAKSDGRDSGGPHPPTHHPPGSWHTNSRRVNRGFDRPGPRLSQMMPSLVWRTEGHRDLRRQCNTKALVVDWLGWHCPRRVLVTLACGSCNFPTDPGDTRFERQARDDAFQQFVFSAHGLQSRFHFDAIC